MKNRMPVLSLAKINLQEEDARSKKGNKRILSVVEVLMA